MSTKKASLHIHSNHTDGLYSIDTILKEFKKKGIDIISITDHNEISGSLKAKELAKKYKMQVIPGIELYFKINRNFCEVLVYFRNGGNLKSFFREFMESGFIPKFKNIEELFKIIRKHKGSAIIPHPFAKKGLLYNHISFNLGRVEVINSFSNPKENKKAEEYFKDKILKIGSNDFHFGISSLDSSYTLLKSKNRIDYNSLWNNLSGKNKDIEFIPIGGSLPFFKRNFQKLICSLFVTFFLTKQLIKSKLGKR